MLDKTGTITEGKPDVVEAVGLDDQEAAAALLAIESRSEHPLAEAVTRPPAHHRRSSSTRDRRDESLTGKGVKAIGERQPSGTSATAACWKRTASLSGMPTRNMNGLAGSRPP
ncbi:MAG: HAD family hydrolase [Flavobacteriales bacterium]|nr:HAD family hydrolase [Flavobacteriales bacterium]